MQNLRRSLISLVCTCIQPFIDVLASQQFQAEADIDRNGVVNFFDIQPFIDILAGTN